MNIKLYCVIKIKLRYLTKLIMCRYYSSLKVQERYEKCL
jgi:hypothetical protein